MKKAKGINCNDDVTFRFQDVFEAMKSDNVEKLEECLNKHDRKLSEILNAPFKYPVSDILKLKNDDVNTLVSLPLHVAVVNGSRCVIRHLLSRDVDFFACDNNNNNILHSLIAVAHTHKNQREAKAAQTYDW